MGNIEDQIKRDASLFEPSVFSSQIINGVEHPVPYKPGISEDEVNRYAAENAY